MGECPEWYPLFRAARYLGVPPWELAKQPIFFQNCAIEMEAAHIEAENERAKRK
jgi:hypothetical protein